MERFLGWIKQLAKWWFIGAGVVATGILIMMYMAFSSLSKVTTITRSTPVEEVEEMPDAALLHLDLVGSIQRDRPDADNVWAGFMGLQERNAYLTDIRKGLRQAADDDRVKGLWITTGQIMASSATINELRRLIMEFKESSKKPVKIHVAMVTNAQLLLASAADEVIIPPLADIFVPGPQFQLTYFGDAVKKLGFAFDVVKAGRFKSAMEPMTSNDPSAASQEMYKAMVSSSTDFFTGTIAKGRGQSADKVLRWFDQAIFSPEQAVEAGLADQMGYAEDQTEAFAKTLEAEAYKFSDYTRSSAVGLLASSSSSSPIAIIKAEGEITSLASSGDEAITPQKLLPRLRWAMEEDDVKAVVLEVNSPGGSANASDIIWKEIRRLDAKKPVVVLMTDVAASGGYFLAAGGRKIIADPLTITGSIGVIYAAAYAPEVKDKYGVSFHAVAEGRQPRNFSEPLSEGERQRLQESIGYTYSNFLDRVALGRNQDKSNIAPLAEGRVYTGGEALKLGLVDQIGGLSQAVAVAQELAGITADPWPLRRYESENPFRQAFQMMSSLQGRVSSWLHGAALESAPTPLRGALPNVKLWKHWTTQRVALSYWPYHGQLH